MPLDHSYIQGQRPRNELHYFRSLGSTMIEAAQLASGGAPHGTVVVADEQTAGVGRLGRSWESEAELGLYCSVILQLPVSGASLPLVTLVLGLAVAEAIQKSTDLACDLRWPNDVLIRERKVAGILAHLLDDCVIAGIGINVNQMAFPPEVRTPATSLRIEASGRMQSRENIAIHLLEALDVFCDMLIHEGSESILRAFSAASSYALHRRVRLEESGRTGVTAGLDSSGFLLVRYDNGQVGRVAAGGVRPDAG